MFRKSSKNVSQKFACTHFLPPEFGCLELSYSSQIFELIKAHIPLITQNIFLIINHNTPGIVGGPGGHDRTLAVKNIARKSAFFL